MIHAPKNNQRFSIKLHFQEFFPLFEHKINIFGYYFTSIIFSALNKYVILSWIVKFTKATSLCEIIGNFIITEITRNNSCRNTLSPIAKHQHDQELLFIFDLVLFGTSQ